jgi:pyridoxal 5'-phosphate synthase pdxS subunit
MFKTKNPRGVELAQMLKGGVIMDVSNVEQAKIAEEAGAVAVMALEKIPSEIRKQGGVARMSNPKMIREIKSAVSIPVMAKARIGHIAEARILEALEIDFIDESEVLTPADEVYHINKNDFKIPFVCGCRDLGEALRRISEGACMIRTKGEAGTGNIVEAVRHQRKIQEEIKKVSLMEFEEMVVFAKKIGVSVEILEEVKKLKKLPVVNFAAGGIATPADAALMMMLGSDGVFVGSGIFNSKDPVKMAKACVQATTFYDDAKKLAKIMEESPEAMSGLEISTLDTKMATRDE